jgi:hypothetical protein
VTANTDDIGNYFFLKRRIKEAEQRLIEIDTLFYAQTMNSYITSDGLTIHSQGFDIQRNCNHHLDVKTTIERNIEIATFKKKHFSRFLQELSKSERLYLKAKYILHREQLENAELERQCLSEINEIETAVRFRFGIEKEERMQAQHQKEQRIAFMEKVKKSIALREGVTA